MGAILLSMSANFWDWECLYTLSLKAMDEMQKINKDKTVASDSMCTFVAITSSSLTVIQVPLSLLGLPKDPQIQLKLSEPLL